ncbi:MAG: hypothetical protein PVJ39_04800 [Gammaproteobacteria bacterium]|jgi:hypothetical protein
MVIVQIAITEELGNRITNIEPFVFKIYTGPFVSTFPNTFGFTFDGSGPAIEIIDFLRAPEAGYQEKTSYSSVVEDEASWYFDTTNQIVYFHVEHDYGRDTTYLSGTAYGYCSDRPIGIGGFQYLPLVKSVPDLSQQQDIIDYDIPSMISGAIELDSSSGELDFFITTDIYGNRIYIFFLDDLPTIDIYEFSDLVQLAALSVDDYDFTVSSVLIRIKDLREEGNVQIPTDLFNATDYPDIKDNLINKPIPWRFGELREVKLICTNGKSTSGNVSYRAGIEMTSFGTPYVKDGDTWTSVTAVSSDTSTGEIVLAEADARNGTNPREAKLVNCEGISNDRSTDVIRELNYRALGTTFDSSNYNIGEWASEELSLGPIALSLEKQKKLFDVIADIQNGSNVGFRYSITADGKRTIRIDSEGRTPVYHVTNTDIQNRNELPVTTDATTLAAIVNIDYDKSYVDDEYYRYTDDSEAETTFNAYKQKPTTTLETLLTTETLAAERGDFHLERFSTIRGIFSGTLMGVKYLTLRIYDLITIEITPADFVNVDNNMIDGREYFGIKLIKILSVDPDIREKQNNISGVIIDDARFPEHRIMEYDGGEEDWLWDDGDFWDFY